MSDGGYKHTRVVKGKVERLLLPVYIVFLLLAPFTVALLFGLKGHYKITALLVVGNGLPAYMMVKSMFKPGR